MYWSDTVETASLAKHQITSECSGQHWTVSDTNLNAVLSWKKKCTSLKNSALKIINLTHVIYSISSDANCCSAYQDIPQNFMQLTIHYRVHKNVIQRSPEAWIVKNHPDTVP